MLIQGGREKGLEVLVIAHQYQVSKNSIEITWYAILEHNAEYLTAYEVEILSGTSNVIVGRVSHTFVDMRVSVARTVQIPISMVAEEGASGTTTEIRGRVRVRGGTSNWSVWCPYKITQWQ